MGTYYLSAVSPLDFQPSSHGLVGPVTSPTLEEKASVLDDFTKFFSTQYSTKNR